MQDFKAFNIKTMPRKQNVAANSLAVAASTFQPVEDRRLKQITIQMLYSPSVPNNIKTIQVFNDDQHIQSFMADKRIFNSQQIGEEQVKPDEGHQMVEKMSSLMVSFNLKQTSSLEGSLILKGSSTKM